MKKTAITLALGALMILPTFAQAGQKDIVDIAAGNPNFKTLVALVKQAGLVDTLKGKGPFTVFAPTDKAFAKLPKDLVAKVVADKALLTKVLTYHVVAGEVLSTSLSNGQKAKTVQGEAIMVSIGKHSKKVMINKSFVTTADIKASNGVIHVIDTVLIPPSLLK